MFIASLVVADNKLGYIVLLGKQFCLNVHIAPLGSNLEKANPIVHPVSAIEIMKAKPVKNM